jgi:hypothetical protein
MKKRTKRLIGLLALTAAATGAAGAFFVRRKRMNKNKEQNDSRKGVSVWARPNMPVTFRAELMPGRSREERTFRVKELLSSGRVMLHGFVGEHTEQEFERVKGS